LQSPFQQQQQGMQQQQQLILNQGQQQDQRKPRGPPQNPVMGQNNPPMDNKQTLDLKKTKICPVVKQGKRCPKADMCNFAHTNEELRAKPNLSKTKMCPMVIKNGIAS
jgi:hypothetical protein